MPSHLRLSDEDPPQLSIIIPCLNEAGHLPALLADLNKQRRLHSEVLLADGSSTDNSAAIAREHGARVIESNPGRGRQMNIAVQQARGEWLLFLHADSRLSDIRQLSRALRCLKQAGHVRVAGHFRLQFMREEKPQNPWLFRYMQAKTALNRPYCVNGDQGMLLHRDYFYMLGGFDESLPFMEDLRLAERITHVGEATGRWITLPGVLQTSARRFETEGAQQRYLLMMLMVIAATADLPEFFERAPKLYQSQDQTGRILLTPYFRLYATILRERGYLRTFMAMGRLGRYHWWQVFFRLDVLFGLQKRPFLAFYDRVIGPLTENPVGDAFSALFAWTVGMGLLRPYFRLREHKALKHRQKDQAND